MVDTLSRGKSVAVASVALACSLGSQRLLANVDSLWTALDGNTWSDPGNWSTAIVPNNGNNGSDFDVTIGTPSPTLLDIPVSIDALMINTGGILQVGAGNTLTLDGPTFTNNGTLIVNPGAAATPAALLLTANTTTTGTGSIYLNDNANSTNARIDIAANATLTLGNTTTLYGHGALTGNLTNHGTINANSSIANATLFLQGSILNDKTMEATNNGTLSLNNATVSQLAPGQILANGGAHVNVVNSSILHGALTSGIFQILSVPAPSKSTPIAR